jgi:hypothetical protein
MINFT